MKFKYSILFILICLLFSLPAWAASTKEEILELRLQVAEIQKDLMEIKQLLKDGARAAPAAVPSAAAPQPTGFTEQVVSIGNSPVKGEEDAPVTVIEYSDYQCPFCARHFQTVMPRLQEEYIDTGKIKFVMRENPLTNLHPQAMNGSIAALCAEKQGKYWEMHDVLFANQREMSDDNLKSYAADIGLDTGAFNECLDNKETQGAVLRDLASAAKLGVRGTPGFFIGLTDQGDPDKANLSVFIRGAQSIEQFQASIDDLLQTAGLD